MIVGIVLPGFALATACPDLIVNVTNTTSQKTVGGIWGNTGNLGSGGWFADPGQTYRFTLPSQDYPGGNFGVVGVVQMWGQASIDVQCTAVVPAINGCPDPAVQPLSMTVIASSPTVACTFVLATP